jgi:hypothetical protein
MAKDIFRLLLIIEGVTERVTQVIVKLKLTFNKNVCFNELKSIFEEWRYIFENFMILFLLNEICSVYIFRAVL